MQPTPAHELGSVVPLNSSACNLKRRVLNKVGAFIFMWGRRFFARVQAAATMSWTRHKVTCGAVADARPDAPADDVFGSSRLEGCGFGSSRGRPDSSDLV